MTAISTASEVANYFLEKGKEDWIQINLVHLLGLVYTSYGWYAVMERGKLFDESIEAWEYGPVIPAIYYEFQHFGKNPIEGYSMGDREAIIFEDRAEDDSDQHPYLKNDTASDILKTVWNVYKSYPTQKWYERLKGTYGDLTKYQKISFKEIREYYDIFLTKLLEVWSE